MTETKTFGRFKLYVGLYDFLLDTKNTKIRIFLIIYEPWIMNCELKVVPLQAFSETLHYIYILYGTGYADCRVAH